MSSRLYAARTLVRAANAILLRKQANFPSASEVCASGIALLALRSAICKQKIAVSRLKTVIFALLIAISCRLIAISKQLIVVFDRLIAISRSKIAVLKPLIAISRLLIAIFTSLSARLAIGCARAVGVAANSAAMLVCRLPDCSLAVVAGEHRRNTDQGLQSQPRVSTACVTDFVR